MSIKNSSKLSQKQTLCYLIHHFESLKSLANKINFKTKIKDNDIILNPQLISQQILQNVELMQRRLCFFIDNKSQIQFEDYITQFYQEEINKLRQQINRLITKANKFQQKLRQTSASHNGLYSQIITQNNDNFSLLQQRQMTIKLKKEISHCQSLIQQNQGFIQDQNNVIKQLTQQIQVVQSRESQSRLKYQQSVLKYQQKIKEKGQKFREICKQFSENRKVYQKQLKQLQVNNIKFIQEKNLLQEQLILKSQELNILAKKIYDLQLCISKYERQFQAKKEQNQQNNEALVLLDKEVRVWKNKYIEVQNTKKSKLDLVIEDKKMIESKNKELTDEIQNLKKKINQHYKVNEISAQKKEKKLKQQLLLKQEEVVKLENNLQQTTSKHNSLSNQNKQLEKQLSAINYQKSQLEDQLNKLQGCLSDQGLSHQQMIKKFNEQKSMMKKQIYVQVEELLKINEQTVKRIRIQQVKISELNEEMEERNGKIELLNKMLLKMEIVNDEIKKRNESMMKQLIDYKEIKIQMQQKQDEVKKELEEALKYRAICKQQEKHVKEIEKSLETLKQEMDSLQKQKSNIQKQKNNLHQKLSTHSHDSTSKQSLTQQISILRQQHHKKDFMIKQLQSKISILQQQLRQTSEMAQIQRNKMKGKIKEMQDLVRERYDFSNRPSNQG